MENDRIVKEEYRLISPSGWVIPAESTAIHGITQEYAYEHGVGLAGALFEFLSEHADCWIAHNMNFDMNVVANAALWDVGLPYKGFPKWFCTMEASAPICKIPKPNGWKGYKHPKLAELYTFIMKKPPVADSLHNSLYDTRLLAEVIQNSYVLRDMIGLPKRSVVLSENDSPSSSSRIMSISLA
jgi:DNA polymerase III epsilon subunit-like protein